MSNLNEDLVFIEAYRNYDIYLNKRNYLFSTPVLPDLECKDVRELKETIDEVITKDVGKEIVFYNEDMQVCRITSMTATCFWMTQEGRCLERKKYERDIFKKTAEEENYLHGDFFVPANEEVEVLFSQRRKILEQIQELREKEKILIKELKVNYAFRSFSEVLEYGILKNQEKREKKNKNNKDI